MRTPNYTIGVFCFECLALMEVEILFGEAYAEKITSLS